MSKKKWVSPRLVEIEPRSAFRQGWTSEQVREVRRKVQEALDLIESTGEMSDAAAQLKLVLLALEAELTPEA